MGDAEAVIRAAWTIGITLLAIFGIAVVGGFWMLRRRYARSPRPEPEAPIQQRVGILLVRLDDAVTTGEDELHFAIAQFGPEVTDSYARVLASARASLTEAFTLQ